jgi:hypothetical protein
MINNAVQCDFEHFNTFYELIHFIKLQDDGKQIIKQHNTNRYSFILNNLI